MLLYKQKTRIKMPIIRCYRNWACHLDKFLVSMEWIPRRGLRLRKPPLLPPRTHARLFWATPTTLATIFSLCQLLSPEKPPEQSHIIINSSSISLAIDFFLLAESFWSFIDNSSCSSVHAMVPLCSHHHKVRHGSFACEFRGSKAIIKDWPTTNHCERSYTLPNLWVDRVYVNLLVTLLINFNHFISFFLCFELRRVVW